MAQNLINACHTVISDYVRWIRPAKPPPPHGSSWSDPLARPAGRNIGNLEGMRHTQVSTVAAARSSN